MISALSAWVEALGSHRAEDVVFAGRMPWRCGLLSYNIQVALPIAEEQCTGRGGGLAQPKHLMTFCTLWFFLSESESSRTTVLFLRVSTRRIFIGCRPRAPVPCLHATSASVPAKSGVWMWRKGRCHRLQTGCISNTKSKDNTYM